MSWLCNGLADMYPDQSNTLFQTQLTCYKHTVILHTTNRTIATTYIHAAYYGQDIDSMHQDAM